MLEQQGNQRARVLDVRGVICFCGECFVREIALTFDFGWRALYIGLSPLLQLQWWPRTHTYPHHGCLFWCINCPFGCSFGICAYFLSCLSVLCNDKIQFGMSAYCSGGEHCSGHYSEVPYQVLSVLKLQKILHPFQFISPFAFPRVKLTNF